VPRFRGVFPALCLVLPFRSAEARS